MMCFRIILVLLNLFVNLGFFGNFCLAQSDHADAILQRLPKTTDCFLRIEYPAKLADWLEGMKIEPRILEILRDWSVDEKTGIWTPDDLDKIANGWQGILEELRRIKSLTIVFYDLDPKQLKWVVFLQYENVDLEEGEQSYSRIRQLSGLLRGLGEFPANTPEPKLSSDSTLFKNTVIFGSEPEAVEQLSRETKAPLAKDRRFLRAWTQLPSGSDVQIFVVPESLRAFFSDLDDQQWESWQVQEMVGASVALNFDDSSEGPVGMTGRATVAFTVPPTGMVDLWSCCRELESYPKIPFPFYEFEMENYDTTEKVEAFGRMQKAINPNGETYMEVLNRTYEPLGLNAEKDVVPAHSLSLGVRYLQKFAAVSEMRPMLLSIWGVNDKAAARRYVEAVVKKTNQNRGNPTRDMKLETGILRDSDLFFFSETEEAARYHAARQFGSEPENEPEFQDRFQATDDEPLFPREVQAVNNAWYVRSERDAALRFLVSNSEEGDESQDYTSLIRDNVLKIRNREKLSGKLFRVEFFTPNSWSTYSWVNSPIEQLDPDQELLTRPRNRTETKAALRQAVAWWLTMKLGTQIRCYSMEDRRMTVGFTVFDRPEELLPHASKDPESWFGSWLLTGFDPKIAISIRGNRSEPDEGGR